MIIVADTNILVSGLFWKGKAARILEGCKAGMYTNYISIPILNELRRVLAYKKFKLSPNEIGAAIGMVLSFSQVVVPTVKVKAIKTDPHDNMFIECAIACNAQFIISGDVHLLDLGEYRGIRIVTASEFLEAAALLKRED
jgi:putative PIN family toxin of toxin-antitoxin system